MLSLSLEWLEEGLGLNSSVPENFPTYFSSMNSPAMEILCAQRKQRGIHENCFT